MTLYQNCLNGPIWLNEMATRAKNRKKGKNNHASVNNLLNRHLLLNRWMDFEIILQECSLSDPLPKFLKWFRLAEMAARAKNRLVVVGWCEGAVYLTSPGRPTDMGVQLGKACYPCSG